MSIRITDWADAGTAERDAALRRPAQHADADFSRRVGDIIREVRERGDEAVRDLTRQFDRASPASLKVDADEFERAERQLTAAEIDALDLAIANVRRFHASQVPVPLSMETMPGVRCERVSHPVDAVGLYVPAGTAPLPSAAVMLSVPAVLAGCPTVIMCTAPRADGSANPAVLTAARRAGVTDIFKIGGAQAIAAMAYGTESVPGVNKVFGPGNAWVTEAKSQVAADPRGAAIDMPAGPSEVLVIADGHADAEFVAADLLSQAEHGVDSQVLLVTTDAMLANRVVDEVDRQLALLGRREIAAQSIGNSRVIVTAALDDAIRISNAYAPEHLILHLAAPREALSRVRNAGSVFLGAWSPESVGDYCSGTNHVLPTYGYARNFSGLSVDHFVRHMTVQELSREGLATIGDTVIRLANLEGLDAHAAAVHRRLARMEERS